jgi:hypothetical protein
VPDPNPTASPGLRARRRLASGALVLALFAALLFGLACRGGKLSPGLSKTLTEMKVIDVKTRGPYLEVLMDMSGTELYAYVLPGEVCDRVLEPLQTVTYVDSGPLGLYRRGEDECQAMGVGNLRVWRNRRGRTSSGAGGPAPRSQANYREIYRDDQVALLRGNFPQAWRIGFSGGADLVAVVPTTLEQCKTPIESGVASIEFREKGRNVLSLVGPSGLCEIRGLIQPEPQGRRVEDVEAAKGE